MYPLIGLLRWKSQLAFVGPVYEAELERKKPLFQALQEVVQPLGVSNGWLPDFYNKNIEGAPPSFRMVAVTMRWVLLRMLPKRGD